MTGVRSVLRLFSPLISASRAGVDPAKLQHLSRAGARAGFTTSTDHGRSSSTEDGTTSKHRRRYQPDRSTSAEPGPASSSPDSDPHVSQSAYLKMKVFPKNALLSDVVKVFDHYGVTTEDVRIVYTKELRPQRIVVRFASDGAADEAFASLAGEHLGTRRMRIMRGDCGDWDHAGATLHAPGRSVKVTGFCEHTVQEDIEKLFRGFRMSGNAVHMFYTQDRSESAQRATSVDWYESPLAQSKPEISFLMPAEKREEGEGDPSPPTRFSASCLDEAWKKRGPLGKLDVSEVTRELVTRHAMVSLCNREEAQRAARELHLSSLRNTTVHVRVLR